MALWIKKQNNNQKIGEKRAECGHGILKKLGWSRQKPITRASQRNETAIEQWRTEKWNALEKKPNRKGAP